MPIQRLPNCGLINMSVNLKFEKGHENILSIKFKIGRLQRLPITSLLYNTYTQWVM